MNLASVASFATVYRTIGFVIATIVIVGVVVYAVVNVVFASKPELGSEIELAANRKPYYDDETLEGAKLDRSLSLGLLTLFVLAVALPLYWVMEPGRQENAAEDFGRKFESRGAGMFAATGEGDQALNCAGCHGGMDGLGGVVEYNRPLPDGSVDPVQWRAPALNTSLLRYSREEIEFILIYGRPGTPMPAWGVDGGGALNEQQIQNLVDYLESIQISPEEAQAEVAEQLEQYMGAVDGDGELLFSSEGEALFNMGLLDDFAGGAYSCARCHTSGWSYQRVDAAGADGAEAAAGGEAGAGGGESAAPAEGGGAGGGGGGAEGEGTSGGDAGGGGGAGEGTSGGAGGGGEGGGEESAGGAGDEGSGGGSEGGGDEESTGADAPGGGGGEGAAGSAGGAEGGGSAGGGGAEAGASAAYDGEDVAEVLEIAGCGGAFGPSLCEGSTERQFPVNPDPVPGESPFQEMVDLITVGSELGIGYGQTGQGSGKMPGFGQRPEEEELFWINKNEPREFPVEGEGDTVMNTGMLTPDMIEDIVDYERGL
jgi:cytochrome c553